jgi:hypothetical protein
VQKFRKRAQIVGPDKCKDDGSGNNQKARGQRGHGHSVAVHNKRQQRRNGNASNCQGNPQQGQHGEAKRKSFFASFFSKKEDSSFSEEKEAKRLLFLVLMNRGLTNPQGRG